MAPTALPRAVAAVAVVGREALERPDEAGLQRRIERVGPPARKHGGRQEPVGLRARSARSGTGPPGTSPAAAQADAGGSVSADVTAQTSSTAKPHSAGHRPATARPTWLGAVRPRRAAAPSEVADRRSAPALTRRSVSPAFAVEQRPTSRPGPGQRGGRRAVHGVGGRPRGDQAELALVALVGQVDGGVGVARAR